MAGILAQPRPDRSPVIRGPTSARGCAGWVRGALSSSSAHHRYVSGVAMQGAHPSPLALPGHVVDDWRLGKEVIGNCFEVAVAERFETIVDGFPHRALDFALLGRGAGSQELDKVILFPFADPVSGFGVMLGTS